MEQEVPLLSILIPTVDPTERVPAMVRELLACDATNFQIVVMLNAPTSPLKLLEKELKDSRLLVTNESVRLNVAENWSKAVETSTGKYLWLIGDDDFILSKQLSRVLNLLQSAEVDCLTFDGYSYLFPSSFTEDRALSRESHFHLPRQLIGNLSENEKKKVVKQMYKFIPLLPLNMQLTIFSRSIYNVIGNNFKMPFPDHIALMEMLLANGKWKVVNERLCIVGMAPSSFGNSAYTNSFAAGRSYLGIVATNAKQIPGNILNSVMLEWLGTLSETNPAFRKFHPSRGNYVIRQIGFSYRQLSSKTITSKVFFNNLKSVRPLDWLFVIGALMKMKNLTLITRILSRAPGVEKIVGAKFTSVPERDIVQFANGIKYK